MNASLLLKANVDALLRVQHKQRKDLALWCRKSESWISKIYREERRRFPITMLDRIADFFGVAVYQLLQPGMAAHSERRLGERRTGKDRRLTPNGQTMLAAAAEREPYRPGWKVRPHVAAETPHIAEIKRLSEQFERQITALLARTEPRGQAPTARVRQPKTSAGSRTGRGRDPEAS